MKILVVHSIYRPYKKGGAEVVVEKFVDELKKKHEVIVLTTEPRQSTVNSQQSTNTRESVEDGVTVIRFTPLNLFTIHDIEKKPFWMRFIWHMIDVWNVHSWFVVRNILKTYQPDIVWTHGMKGIGYLPMKAIRSYVLPLKIRGTKGVMSHEESITPLTPLTLRGGQRRRWILTPHSEELIYQFGYGMYPFKIGIVEKVTMFFTRWFTRGVDRVLAPSRQIIELHEEYGFWKQAEKISFWPCFVEKKSYMLPLPETFTFGFIGQLEEHKGIRQLVEAFKSYNNQNVRLFIAGRGNQASWVQEQSTKNPNVTFFGEYNQNQLEMLFSNISVLVVSSLIRDNMPTVILEAFAHARPVIGSNLGGIPEILEDTRGILLKGFERKDFHEAFDEVQKPELYQVLVENVRKWKPVTIQEVLEKIGL